MQAETFLDICTAYVTAWQADKLQSDAQIRIAMKAAIFTAACAKVGLLALIDEATGYARELRQRMFLSEEMRKWESTFPKDLWFQFGRLANWKGARHSHPDSWNKLLREVIYVYLDADVVQWLRENTPKPSEGKNYHQWVSEQYGLKRLVEHTWMVIGIASTCEDTKELKAKMEELHGKRRGFE
jgi:hypothetical protein